MYNEREREGERDTKQLVKEGRKASQNRTEHWNSFPRFLIQHGNGWPYECERIDEREANAFWTCEQMKKKNRNNVNETLSIKKKYMYTYWLLETTLMRLWVSIINFNFHQSSLNEEQSSVWRFVYGVFWCKKPQSLNPHGIWNKIQELREKERAATTVCVGAEFCCHWCWRRLWDTCLWIELWLWRIARDREF